MKWWWQKDPVVIKYDPNVEWKKITDVKDFPDSESLFKYGSFATLIYLLKILYEKNLEIARQNEDRTSG